MNSHRSDCDNTASFSHLQPPSHPRLIISILAFEPLFQSAFFGHNHKPVHQHHQRPNKGNAPIRPYAEGKPHEHQHKPEVNGISRHLVYPGRDQPLRAGAPEFDHRPHPQPETERGQPQPQPLHKPRGRDGKWKQIPQNQRHPNVDNGEDRGGKGAGGGGGGLQGKGGVEGTCRNLWEFIGI